MSEFTPPGGEPPRPEPRPDPWQGAARSSYGGPRPYDDTSAAYARARTSKKMAGWALGLSLLICVPFAPLVGLGLGIAVLVRSREGQDHGKGLGVAAVVIGGLYVLAIAGLFVAGIVAGIQEEIEGPERDDSGELAEPGDIWVDDLRVGDCVSRFERSEDLAPDEDPTGMVTVVRCDTLHLAEVYHIFHIDPDEYDDQTALDRASEWGCISEYRSYVGKPYERSILELNYYNPTKGEGIFEDDEVICLVTAPTRTSDRLKGSRR